MLLWLIAPALWAIPVVLAISVNSTALSIFSIAWVFLVIFGLGIYLHVILPSNDDVSIAYKKLIIPELLQQAGIEAEYSLAHGLKVDSFKKAGLYQEHYSHFERTDSVIGKYRGIKFGLYELAVQVADSIGGTLPGAPSASFLTNHFYGWVLHVPVKPFAGTVHIIPRSRKNTGESDDWLKAVIEHYDMHYDRELYRTDDPEFDHTFSVYATSETEAKFLLQPAFIHFLLEAYRQSANAPAFAFVENRAYMHVGISDSGFEKKRGQVIYPPDTQDLTKKIRYFCLVIAALHAASAQKPLL